MLVKEKEKDLEKGEEKGCLLIQDKTGETGSVIKETIKRLNQSWANLGHMVGSEECISLYVVVAYIVYITILH